MPESSVALTLPDRAESGQTARHAKQAAPRLANRVAGKQLPSPESGADSSSSFFAACNNSSVKKAHEWEKSSGRAKHCAASVSDSWALAKHAFTDCFHSLGSAAPHPEIPDNCFRGATPVQTLTSLGLF